MGLLRPYLRLTSLRKRYASRVDRLYEIRNDRKTFNRGSYATHTHTCLPLILIIVSSTKIKRTSLLSTTSNLSQMGANRLTHCLIASYVLSIVGSRILDALLRL